MALISERACARYPHSSLSRLLLSTLFLLVACVVVLAQGGVGSTRGLPDTNDGIHTIKGRIYFPTEPKEGKRLRVVLRSADTTDQTTQTDEDGNFAFNRIRSGNYTVTVEGGREYDDYSEAASIDRAASVGGRIINLAINLRPKGTAAAISKIPKAARELYAKGQEAAAKGDSKKAVEHFSGAVALYPEFGPALYEMGVQYLRLGEVDQAAEALKGSLKLDPNEASPRLSYGIVLLQQKKYTEAETELRAVIQKNDNLPTAHMYLGIALMSQKKFDEAEKELLRAISFKSNEVSMAHRYLGGLYWAKRDYPRAADELETYLKLVPKAADAERTRAAIKELRGKKAETPEKN